MKTEINWKQFHEIQELFKNTLTHGESGLLSEKEKLEINARLEDIIHPARRINYLFSKAVSDFQKVID